MFKNATIYKAAGTISVDKSLLVPFEPCMPTQELSYGWVAPNDGELIEVVNGDIILSLMIETKKVPTDVMDRAVEERCAAILASTGRKPGKKEKREIKDELLLDLLPKAFPSRKKVMVWLDTASDLVWVESASTSVCDVVLNSLVALLPGVNLSAILMQFSAPRFMKQMLLEADSFSPIEVGSECELVALDESKSKVRYDNHNLDTDEVKDHLSFGKEPSKLGLIFDDRVSLVLNHDLTLKKIQLLDVVMESSEGDFRSDVMLTTSELRLVYNQLKEALGGEFQNEP